MPNTIQLAEKYLPLVEEVYRVGSVTGTLDLPTNRLKFTDANKVSAFVAQVDGMTDYERNVGFVTGSASGSWVDYELEQDRQSSFTVDSMDNEETFGVALGAFTQEMYNGDGNVNAEMDAYRISKYSQNANIQRATPAVISDPDEAVEAVEAGRIALNKASVPMTDRIMLISADMEGLLMASEKNKRYGAWGARNVDTGFDTWERMPYIVVPDDRFYNKVKLRGKNDTPKHGYEAGTSAVSNNFMIIHRSAVMQVVKHAVLRVWDPSENILSDGWLVQYRLYHDAFVRRGKEKGIYLHSSTANRVSATQGTSGT